MKEKQPLRKLLIWILSLSIVLLFGLSFIKHLAFVDSADRGFFSFFSMIRYAVIDYPVETFTTFNGDVARFWDSRYKEDILRKQLSEHAADSIKVEELEQEIEKLKQLNGLDSVYSEYSLISGRVIMRAMDSWNQVVTIDIGSDKGVEVDDAVVTATGMVGRVIQVTPVSATVKLLSANDEFSQSAVKINLNTEGSVQGVLKGYDSDKKTFIIQLMDSSASIQPDMKVYTSGLGGVYPSGLYIGTVESVKAVADSVGILVYVTPGAEFNSLDYIKVVDKP